MIYDALRKFSANNENEIVAAIRDGDAEAFEQVFNIYGKRLYSFSLGYLKSATDAEEVVQEVFFKIWKNRKSLNPELSFKAYLFKIAFNHIRELFLKLSYEKAYQHEILQSNLNTFDDFDKRTNYQSLLELVDRLIEELPPRQKEILIKRRKEGLPIKEIARELDISPKTVENHLTEAIKKIKAGLGEDSISGLLFLSLFLEKK